MKRHLILILLVINLPFNNLLSQTVSQECACCSDKHSEFHFWLGDWEVFQGEKLAGHNSINIAQDSCVMIENWRSAAGVYTGTSYNFYNKNADKWQQVWVDNQGSQLELSGNLENGKMVLYSEEMLSQKNKKYINRITWTPNADGSVIQHWEMSTDKGKSWSTLFNGLYKRK